jgi:hypothetical protein
MDNLAEPIPPGFRYLPMFLVARSFRACFQIQPAQAWLNLKTRPCPRRSDKQVRVSAVSALAGSRDMSFHLFLGLVTPLGGVALLAGWACITLAG